MRHREQLPILHFPRRADVGTPDGLMDSLPKESSERPSIDGWRAHKRRESPLSHFLEEGSGCPIILKSVGRHSP